MSVRRGALAGRRVAVTRPAADATDLVDRLAARGAVPILLPLTCVRAPVDPGPLLRAVRGLDGYDWIVFTSANAARALADVLPHPAERPTARIAAVGPATAAAVHDRLGWQIDAVPAVFTSGSVARAMSEVAAVEGQRVFWPRAAAARDELPRELAAAGAEVADPIAYRMEPVPESARELHRLVAAGQIDAITFASPSAVRSFADEAPTVAHTGVVVAVIGPVTATAARHRGIPVHVQAREHTIPALVEALCCHMCG